MGVLGKLSPFSRSVVVSRRADARYPAQITLLIALSMALLFASLVRAGDLQVLSAAAAQSTSFGLRVTPGSTCSAASELEFTAGSISPGDHQACNRITAGGASGVTTSGNTTFTAGEEIVLKHKFTVDTGDSFAAIISSPLTQWAYVQDNSPSAEKTYKASFYLRVGTLTIANTTDRLHHFVGYSSDGTPWFRVVLRKNNGEKRLVLEARKDNGNWKSTEGVGEVWLPAGWNNISIQWSAGQTGEFQVSLDGVNFSGLSDLDNSNAQIDHVKWGAVGTDPESTGIAAISGYLDVDEFSSWR